VPPLDPPGRRHAAADGGALQAAVIQPNDRKA
jgi:hypothetical protein